MNFSEIEKLLRDVTPGPWRHAQEAVDPEWSIVTTFGGAVIANINDRADRHPNARFIAAARDLVPALLKERDEARARAAAAFEMAAEFIERRDGEIPDRQEIAAYIRALATKAERDALAKIRAEARARIDELEAFIADFAAAKFDSLKQPNIRHPADELDPVTDAMIVWAWQEDARELLKGEKK